jgi:hypothetical protein
MTLYSLDRDGKFVVLRKRWATLSLILLMIAAFVGVGVWSMLDSDQVAFLIFGVAFTAIGLWIAIVAAQNWRRLMDPNGLLVWSVSTAGIEVSSGFPLEPNRYAWPDVKRVVLTEKWRQSERGEKQYVWQVLLVFLDTAKYGDGPVFDASRRGRFKSPAGEVFALSYYPRNEQQRVKERIAKFAPPPLAVETLQQFEFDTANSREQQTDSNRKEAQPQPQPESKKEDPKKK